MAKLVSSPAVSGKVEYRQGIEGRFLNQFGSDAYVGTMFPYLLEQESADKQMNFQEYMSNTAHQREVSDLVKAGLNPVLSANAGASSPSGASASSDATAISGTIQKRLLDTQIKSQQKLAKLERKQALKIAREQIYGQMAMNKYSTDMSYQLGQFQSLNSLAGMKYQADASASAQRYAAYQAALASMYGSDQARAAAEFSARTQYATGSQQRQHEKDMQTAKYYYDRQLQKNSSIYQPATWNNLFGLGNLMQAGMLDVLGYSPW